MVVMVYGKLLRFVELCLQRVLLSLVLEHLSVDGIFLIILTNPYLSATQRPYIFIIILIGANIRGDEVVRVRLRNQSRQEKNMEECWDGTLMTAQPRISTEIVSRCLDDE